MELLLREEVALLLATLAACGLLVLGVLELVWPTGPSGGARRREPPHRVDDPAPVFEPPEPRRPEPADDEPPAARALRIGRGLLERALADADPVPDRRVRMMRFAIACLERGLQAAPKDPALRGALARAQAALEATQAPSPSLADPAELSQLTA